jgi:MFS family permease
MIRPSEDLALSAHSHRSLGGRSGDILGRRRMFSAGILVFTLASLLGGFATHSWLLITARVLQGVGAGWGAGWPGAGWTGPSGPGWPGGDDGPAGDGASASGNHPSNHGE